MWTPTLAELRAADKVNEHGQLCKDAFSGDASRKFTLTTVLLPEGVTSIEDDCRTYVGAFSGCKRLEAVVLPKTLTVIGGYAFSHCEGLRDIALPNTVTAIGHNVFAYCSSLEEIALPDTLVGLSVLAFHECSNLRTIALPDTLRVIDEGAFLGCSSLREVALPNMLFGIGSGAFYGCSSLTEITLPDTVTAISRRTFLGCSSLREIVLPSTLTAIGESAFDGCSSLQKIKIPATLAAFGESAFHNCSSLQEIVMPDTLLDIGDNAFAGCSSLREVELPCMLTRIGERAFSRCSNLQTVALPSTLATIGKGAFARCSSLTSVALSDTLVAAMVWSSNEAFQKCSSLTMLFVVASPTTRAALATATTLWPVWNAFLPTHLPHITRVWAPDVIVAVLGGLFEAYSRWTDLPTALQAAPARIQSWAGVELWRWWTPPDVAGAGDVAQFRLLSMHYRAAVWTLLLICERCAAGLIEDEAEGGRGGDTVVPYAMGGGEEDEDDLGGREDEGAWYFVPDVVGQRSVSRLTAEEGIASFTPLMSEQGRGVGAGAGACGCYMDIAPPQMIDHEIGVYGEVPMELWMLIFGFCRRDVPVQHTLVY
jgi:hypothetical protein